MMKAIHFVVPGEPRAKQRQARMAGGFARVTNKPKTIQYESLVAHEAKTAMGDRAPLTGPVGIFIRINIPAPKSASKTKRADMLEGRIRPCRKPDCSNVLKSIEDGCNRIVFDDDCQIVSGSFTKLYAETAGVDVIVTDLT